MSGFSKHRPDIDISQGKLQKNLEQIPYQNIFVPRSCRASGGIGILISNKYANLTRIDHTYDYLVWLTLATDCCQKNIKIGCTYIPPENST